MSNFKVLLLVILPFGLFHTALDPENSTFDSKEAQKFPNLLNIAHADSSSGGSNCMCSSDASQSGSCNSGCGGCASCESGCSSCGCSACAGTDCFC